MKTIFIYEIDDHPIFGDCSVEMEVEGYKKEIDDFKVLSINNKKYKKSVLKSMDAYIYKSQYFELCTDFAIRN